ncbi:unnamed protein product, partial [Ilex paraguariensis]
MDVGRESSIPQIRHFQIEGSWIPATPVKKPSTEEPQPICTDRHENQPNWLEKQRFSLENQQGQAGWRRLERFSNGFSPETETREVAACCDSTNFIEFNGGLDYREAALDAKTRIYGDNVNICNKFFMNSVDQYNDLRFGDLLALADGKATAGIKVNTTSSSLISNFNSQIEDNQFKAGTANPILGNESLSGGSNFPLYSDGANIKYHGGSVPSQPSCHLNSPPRTAADAVMSRNISSQFAPITPDQAKRQKVEVDELHQEKEQSQLLDDQLCAAVSTQLQDNHNPDKGGDEADVCKTPQQKPRKIKHRPKVVKEGQPKRTYKRRTTKPAGTAETPKKSKRKYVRKNSTATGSAEVTSGTTSTKTVGCKRKSCRRALNYDVECQVQDESSSCRPSSNVNSESHAQNFCSRDQSRSLEQLTQRVEVTVEKTQMDIAHNLPCSMEEVIDSYLSMPGRQASIPSTPAKADLPPNEFMVNTQSECSRGKCRIVFSDETHDKEASTVEIVTSFNAQSAPRSPNDSYCSSSTCLMNGKQTRGLKREHSCTTDEAYNSLQPYVALLPVREYSNARMSFPSIYKEKRTEKAQDSATSSRSSTVTATANLVQQSPICPPNDSCANPYTSHIDCTISDPQFDESGAPTATASSGQGKQHTFEFMLALGHTKRLRKKISKGSNRVQEIYEQLPSSPTPGVGYLNQPHPCMEAVVAENHATTAKKRTKRNLSASSVPPNMYTDGQIVTMSMGPRVMIWEALYSLDVIAELFRHLNINAESNQVTCQEENALFPNGMRYQGQNALVLYQRDGTVGPFEGSFDLVKKRRPRAKVDLDDETNRVWKLLLEDINSKGIDGTNEEKEKWWEEERRVFHGRADSFIARMHLVQGDRRFSQWKGSVVDSVVGVFLTQNVSDHLSSSAYMSLAARFPLLSKRNHGSPQEERTDLLTEEPGVCVIDPDDTIQLYEQQSNQTVSDQGSTMLQTVKNNGEKDSNASSRSSTIGITSADTSEIQFLDSSKNSPDMNPNSAAYKSGTQISRTVAICTGGQREMDDLFSSQNYVASSPKSLDSSIAQTDERIGSCLQSSSEGELTAGSIPSSFGSSTSFVKLLQMAGTLPQEVYNQASGNILFKYGNNQSEGMASDPQGQNNDRSDSGKTTSRLTIPSSANSLHHIPDPGAQRVECFSMLGDETRFSGIMKKREENCTSQQSGFSEEFSIQATVQRIRTVCSQKAPKSFSEIDRPSSNLQIEVNKFFQSQKTVEGPNDNVGSQHQENNRKMQQVLDAPNFSGETLDVSESTSIIDDGSRKMVHKAAESNSCRLGRTVDCMNTDSSNAKRGRPTKHTQTAVDWDSLRRQVQANDKKRERTANTLDSLDWEAIRCADVSEIAQTIKERGMNNVLAERIKDFLDRLVREHGSIDLEWLRDVPPDKAKEYLLSIRGLGLKSVECVRLLTLHHLAFPVDTNVGRIAVRLGWVPLQPLPESLQLHLLELARLSLPAPEEKSILTATDSRAADGNPMGIINPIQLLLPQANQQSEAQSEASNCNPIVEVPASPEPIVEVPATPEQEQTQILGSDIEDNFCEDPNEIPTIKLNFEEFTQNLQTYMRNKMELQEGVMSKALVALTPEAASIPMPKLKNVSRLRTEHQVYELPDSHPLL